MAKTTNASDKFIIRLPDGMRDRIKTDAEQHGRTMNAEIIARLEVFTDSPSNSDRLDEIMETLIKHDEKLDKLTDMLRRVCEVKNANQTRT